VCFVHYKLLGKYEILLMKFILIFLDNIVGSNKNNTICPGKYKFISYEVIQSISFFLFSIMHLCEAKKSIFST
jgi:hypothetical protein